MLKKDERFLEAMFVRSCDQIIDKVSSYYEISGAFLK